MNTFIHYHTLDLRVHDSPSIDISHSPNNNSTHFLPIYIFDSRQLDLSNLPNSTIKSPLPISNKSSENQVKETDLEYEPKKTRCSPLSRLSGFHRTSPYRLKFLLEAVYGLRESYRNSGSDLLIAFGKPEKILPKLIEALTEKQGKIEGLYAQREYSLEEISNYRRVQNSLKQKGSKLEFTFNDSKTLIPPQHLPFKPETKTPDVYTEFRKKVEGLGIGLNEMLLPPLQTAEIDDNDHLKIKVNDGELKPFPNINLKEIDLNEGDGGFVLEGDELDKIEGLYMKLVKPLIDNPPKVGGWSKEIQIENELPKLNNRSAIPFTGSEISGLQRINDYIGKEVCSGWKGGDKAKKYKETRNGLLGEGFSTKFSTWLSLGSLSPKTIGWRVGQLLEDQGRDKEVYKNVYWILFELLWRDYFQYTVLKTSLTDSYNNKKTIKNDEIHPNSSLFNPDGFSSQISTYPQELRPNPSDWNKSNLNDTNDPARRWCEGKTGVPFIDANMRELIETGWMSNRGRQNVASFLTKDLYCDWRIGAEFFEMHLIDYDTCSNWGNWQYQAGVGNDSRSSRQFNPIKQANDYDENNEFVKTWLPEIRDIDEQYIQTPWLTNDKSKFNDYPSEPVVELPSWKKHYPNQAPTRNRYGKDGKPKGKGKAKGNGNKGPKGGQNTNNIDV
ncbi:uncharacterized protein L201_005723 [Kwoniella dendrophila CBS 6074]|uniref:Cryptochrome DASH n=1 Tax=Kwoniella dendrophila CBS 6074 TaxID=1295534 RepID=A0AAX4JZS9_9TREE